MDLSIENIFKDAINLRDRESYDESIQLLQKIINLYPEHSKIGTVYLVLGGVYRELNYFQKAIDCFKKVQESVPNEELASLGIYLSFIELEKYDDAIFEMNKFLSEYPADRYIETLKELNEDLRNGYARDHESVIIRLSRKFGLSILD